MVRSKYNILQLIILFFGCCFFFFVGISLLQKTAVGIFLIASALFLLYIFFERAPRVSLADDFLSIKYLFQSELRDWSEVVDVQMNTKAPFTVLFIFSHEFEAMVIHFSDGSKAVLFNDMYRNLPELKTFLKTKIAVTEKRKTKAPLLMLGKEVYAGNPYTSLNTITILVFALILLFVVFKPPFKQSVFIGTFCTTAFFFLLNGWQMNYFIIDNDKLIIKNHYFPWIRKSYYLTDITEIATEMPHRRSISLRVITVNQESKLYGAGSLRTRHWDKLQEDLEKIGIPFRRGA